MTTKKYYWLKLKEDFFDDDTIEWLEEQPNGERHCLFYLKLCLKSLKTDGVLIRKVGEILVPYDVKKLAEITKMDIDTVRVALEVFKNIGLVQILENGEIYMTQLKNMVGSETSKAQLMRNKRAKEKALEAPKESKGNIVTDALPKRYTEIEKEKEKEIDKEIDKELTDRQRETIEFLAPLFAGWQVTDDQILFIHSLLNERVPFGLMPYERDIKVYDNLHNLILRAKADNVRYIYRWLIKVIPEVDME
jgi:predicted phage replisome organizer